MNKKILALLLVMASMSATAEFVNESSGSPFDTSDQITIIGNQKPSGNVVGVGRGVPLGEAVSQIIPRNYAAKLLGVERWQNEKISWQGGRVWTEVLRDALKPFPDISADVNQDLKIVTFRPTAEGHANGMGNSGGSSFQSVNKWSIRSGERFSVAMSEWCKKAGCSGLYWEAGDLESELSQTFEGSFEEAVTKAIETLANQGVPIRAVFYSGNGVVRIMEKK